MNINNNLFTTHTSKEAFMYYVITRGGEESGDYDKGGEGVRLVMTSAWHNVTK